MGGYHEIFREPPPPCTLLDILVPHCPGYFKRKSSYQVLNRMQGGQKKVVLEGFLIVIILTKKVK